MAWGRERKDSESTGSPSGWASQSLTKSDLPTGGSEFTILPPVLTLAQIKQKLEAAGATLADVKDGDWIVVFEGYSGFLWERGKIIHVYTNAAFDSPLCRLLSEIGITFSEAPKGGWDNGD